MDITLEIEEKKTSQSLKAEAFLLLVRYLQKSQMRGTAANLPKSFSKAPLIASGWFPLEDLCQFSKLKDLVQTPQDILESIQAINPTLFTLSEDGTCIRPRIDFDAADVEAEWASWNAQHSCALVVVGFDLATPTAEVELYFSKYGEVASVSNHPVSFDIRYPNAYLIQFKNYNTMVKAFMITHKYEDKPLYLKIHKVISENVLVPNQALKTNDNYSKNKVIEFVLKQQSFDGFTSSDIKALFEKFAPVNSIEWDSDASIGYIRFKSTVASDVVQIIKREGGVKLGDQIEVSVRLLEGEEERFFWAVQALKAQSQPTVTKTPSRLSIQISKKGKKTKKTRQQPLRYHNAGDLNKITSKNSGIRKKNGKKVGSCAKNRAGQKKAVDVDAMLEALEML